MARKINASLALGTFAPDREREKALPCDAELRRWHATYAPTMKLSYETLTRGHIETHLAPHFRGRDLREIRETDLLAFVRAKLDQGLAPKTVRNALSVLRRVFNLLQREGRITTNPAARIGEILRQVDRSAAAEVSVIDS
jgi:site-specific recombinase XerC